MAEKIEKLDKEALKHAEDYASHMNTVIKRAYYDGYLCGKKVNIAIEPKLPNGRQGKILAYLKTHDNACVHDIMKLLKCKSTKHASTFFNVLVHKGLVEDEKELSSCKKCKRLHKRYKLCTPKSA